MHMSLEKWKEWNAKNKEISLYFYIFFLSFLMFPSAHFLFLFFLLSNIYIIIFYIPIQFYYQKDPDHAIFPSVKRQIHSHGVAYFWTSLIVPKTVVT